MSDLIRRVDAIEAVLNADPKDSEYHYYKHFVVKTLEETPSTNVESKWNCTANFIAEQLERLKDMTDEERWDFLTWFFNPSTNVEEPCKTCGYYNLECPKDCECGRPSIEVEWIPCSERLPEDGVFVLVTTENEEVYIDQVITDPYKERYFQSNTGYDNFQVIAWMPLPKPYKGDDKE